MNIRFANPSKLVVGYLAMGISLLLCSTPARTAESTEAPKVILGSTKDAADKLLKDWRAEADDARAARLSNKDRSVYYYTNDVELTIIVKKGIVVGVVVTDRPEAGVRSISHYRFEELIAVIGEHPKDEDIVRVGDGIHEFYVGDTEL
jgi:hypothetical protein